MQVPCPTSNADCPSAFQPGANAVAPAAAASTDDLAAGLAPVMGSVCGLVTTLFAAWGLFLPSSAPAAQGLTERAARWLSTQIKVPADRITVLAPDPRWQVPQCPPGLRFDTPFSNANTVRVRCESPQWQVFLRAQWPEEAVPMVSPPPATPGPTVSPRAESAGAPIGQTARPAPEPRRGFALTRAMSRGGLLSPASVEATQVPAREADSLLITDAQFLDQMEAVRDLPAGVPLRQTDIRPAVLVRQGQTVTMTVGQGTGFTVTVRLEALQDGRLGDRVMLRNTESGRTVSGVVTGMNAARGA